MTDDSFHFFGNTTFFCTSSTLGVHRKFLITVCSIHQWVWYYYTTRFSLKFMRTLFQHKHSTHFTQKHRTAHISVQAETYKSWAKGLIQKQRGRMYTAVWSTHFFNAFILLMFIYCRYKLGPVTLITLRLWSSGMWYHVVW
jgi:hypothetical protein